MLKIEFIDEFEEHISFWVWTVRGGRFIVGEMLWVKYWKGFSI